MYDRQISDTFPGLDVTEKMLCQIRERSDRASYGSPMAFSLSDLSTRNVQSRSHSLWYGSQYDPHLLQRRQISLQYPRSEPVGNTGKLMKQSDLTTNARQRKAAVRFPQMGKLQDDGIGNMSDIPVRMETNMVKDIRNCDTDHEKMETCKRQEYINQVDYPRENTSEAKRRSRTIILPNF